jgi:hypothetical protein
MKRLLIAVFCLAFVFALTPRANAGEEVITCTTPLENINHTPLTNLAGFRLYEATTKALQQTATVAQGCKFTATDLAPGTHSWYVTAFTSADEESVPSNPVATIIGPEIPPPQCGPSPPPETNPQICTAPLIGNWQQSRTYQSAPPPACWTPGPWVPTEAAAGVCASPALVTTGTYSYCVTGTATAPTMTSIGYLDAGAPCGPAVRQVGSVKFCQIDRHQTDIFGVCQSDKTLTKGVWSRAQ